CSSLSASVSASPIQSATSGAVAMRWRMPESVASETARSSPPPGAIWVASSAPRMEMAWSTAWMRRLRSSRREKALEVMEGSRLPFSQLELDAAVAVARLGRVGRIERLELAEAGGDEPVGRHTVLDQELDHRGGAGRGQFPVVAVASGAGEGNGVGVAVDPEHPVDLGRNLALQCKDRAGELAHLLAAGLVDDLGAGREQHFRLEDEAVADDADVLAVGEDLAQAAEEVGAVAVELLHALGERHVQAATEIGDLGVGFAVAGLGDFERRFQRADLLAQRGD